MSENMVVAANGYDLIDGRNAYQSDFKRLSIGMPTLEENKNMQIAVQLWREKPNGELEIATELPIHQVMDLMIFLSRTMQHFREAYRLPLLYNPETPAIERLGIQGGVMPVTVCTENPHINDDIQKISQSLSDLSELTGERLRTLFRILEEMECY